MLMISCASGTQLGFWGMGFGRDEIKTSPGELGRSRRALRGLGPRGLLVTNSTSESDDDGCRCRFRDFGLPWCIEIGLDNVRSIGSSLCPSLTRIWYDFIARGGRPGNNPTIGSGAPADLLPL